MRGLLTLRGWVVSAIISMCLISIATSLSAQGSRRRGLGQDYGRGMNADNAGPWRIELASLQLPPVSYEGTLEKITDQLIVVELDNGRTFNFRRSGDTKFYKNSREVDGAELQPGDLVALVAKENDRAFLVAMKVTFEALTPQKRAELEKAKLAAEEADAAGPGPHNAADQPVLKRREAEEPTGQPEIRLGQSPASDPRIDKAQQTTLAFSKTLPNFRCEEHMERFSRDSRTAGWMPLDTISAAVIYEDGQESYRNMKINDRPTERKMEQLSGSWSTGEFATMLRNLFHPDTAATFRYVEDSHLRNLPARVYDFQVARENSHWNIQIDSQEITPAYQGSVWIELASGRVLRLEMHAVDLPPDFPLDEVESTVDYAFVPIGTESVLLPAHAENLGCQRRRDFCSRNVIDFLNYRRYVAESTVKFGP